MNKFTELDKVFKAIYENNQIELNAPMKNLTYFKVGGPADIVLNPSSKDQLINTIKICNENNIPYFIIGNGSNLLVRDGGLKGAVIKLSGLKNIEVDGNKIVAEAGALLKDVSAAAVENELTGFEFACGIPGSVGGAVFMNAGAYDGEISYVISSAEVLYKNGDVKSLDKEELELSYRSSKVMKEGLVVISATFELNRGRKDDIQYKVNDLTKKREDKQPLEFPSAGSTFKRPAGYFTGKLIQDAGLKGFTIGGAAISEKHSGFVINKGGATAKDILDLIAHIQKTIKDVYDVELTTEVRIIGEEV
ncbi:MAG: UDP-N-acetylmuramate dehydrogenase [Clostridium sp.]